MMLSHYLGWLAPVEGLAVRCLAPVQQGIRRVSLVTQNYHQDWLSRRNLLAENQELRENLSSCQFNRSQFNELKAENEILKQELDFVRQRRLEFVSARIITGVSDSLSQSVVINRGRRDGLAEGMAVVVNQGILVGKIYQLGEYSSKVLLLTDNRSKVAATVENAQRTAGLIEGRFGLSFEMTNIPKNQEIAEGDLVVTSGLEGKIPKGLLIAEIETIKEVESEVFKTALLSPIVSFDDLSYLLVVIP